MVSRGWLRLQHVSHLSFLDERDGHFEFGTKSVNRQRSVFAINGEIFWLRSLAATECVRIHMHERSAIVALLSIWCSAGVWWL